MSTTTLTTDRCRTCSSGRRRSAREIAGHAARHDTEGTFVEEGLAAPSRGRACWRSPCPPSWAASGATIRQVDHGPARAGPPLRLDRAGHLDAPARRRLHGVALPPRHARRRGDAAPGGRRGHRARVDRRRRLHPPEAARPRKVDGGYRVSGRKVFASQSAVRHRDVDDVRLRRPRAGPAGAEHGRADRGRGRHRARQLGHARHAGHRQQRHRPRGRVRARRAGARQPALRRGRPAPPGDRQHRHADHLGRLPRRGRGGLPSGGRRAAAQGRATRSCSGRSG